MDYKELAEIKRTISQVDEVMQRAIKESVFEDVKEVLIDAASVINLKLYGSKDVDSDQVSDSDKDTLRKITQLVSMWKLSIERRSGLALEGDFWYLYERFKYVSSKTIIDETINLFESYPVEYKEIFISLPNRYTFLTGRIDTKEKDYSLIKIYVDMLKENIEQFRWLFERLADYRSKQILIRIVRFWFAFNLNDLGDLHENIFGDYYDLDLLEYKANDVLVDCGAYIGDSILDYINTYGSDYKRIYGYEISSDIMEKLKGNVDGIRDVVLKHKGVGSHVGKMLMKSDGAGSKIYDQGEEEIDVTTLDEDIDEPVTIIKMDIEGAETDAIEGAKNHILRERPRLLICTYHKPDDIFKIPQLIYSIRDDYKFFLRFNGRGIWPCDHVLFAV